jgi:hypothetical protein
MTDRARINHNPYYACDKTIGKPFGPAVATRRIYEILRVIGIRGDVSYKKKTATVDYLRRGGRAARPSPRSSKTAVAGSGVVMVSWKELKVPTFI